MVKFPFGVHIKIHLISFYLWLSALQTGRYWVCLLVDSCQPNQLQPEPVEVKRPIKPDVDFSLLYLQYVNTSIWQVFGKGSQSQSSDSQRCCEMINSTGVKEKRISATQSHVGFSYFWNTRSFYIFRPLKSNNNNTTTSIIDWTGHSAQIH